MKGTIKNFNRDRGFGFIYGEGNDIFFHISQVLDNINTIEAGYVVEFDIIETDKGFQATNIIIIDNNNPKFIKIGDSRIKLSNIKDYGIGNDKDYYENQLYECIKEIKNAKKDVKISKKELEEESKDDYSSKSDILLYKKCVHNAKEHLKELLQRKQDLEKWLSEANFDYLYLTTYQGDNIKRYQDKVDYNITEIVHKLDNALL